MWSSPQNGEGFVVAAHDQEYPAVLENGLLRIHNYDRTGMGSAVIAALHLPSSDHLLLGHRQYRRVSATGFAEAERTAETIRSIATAWEARATDINSYEVDNVTDGPISPEAPTGALTPNYMKQVPVVDRWGEHFDFAVRSDGQEYEIRSKGADRTRSSTPPGQFADLDLDIVYSNGSFVSVPAKLSTN